MYQNTNSVTQSRGHHRHTWQPQPHNRKSTRFCGIFCMCDLKAMCLIGCAEATGGACGKNRTCPILCGIQQCCSQSQLDISQCRLPTKRHTQNSLIQKWWDGLTCITSKKLSRMYTSKCKSCRIYTSMDITTETIAAVMGKGQDDKCEVVGQDSFESPTGCYFNTVTCVWEVLWQTTATPTSWHLWRGCGVTHVCNSPNVEGRRGVGTLAHILKCCPLAWTEIQTQRPRLTYGGKEGQKHLDTSLWWMMYNNTRWVTQTNLEEGLAHIPKCSPLASQSEPACSPCTLCRSLPDNSGDRENDMA